LFTIGSIAKSTILQYRQSIAGGGFAATFSGIANNGVVCNRGQYINVIFVQHRAVQRKIVFL